MGKLEYIEINNKEVEIKSELTEDDSNFYTVLIGPNGSGKTKAFEKIIEKYNDEKNNQFSKIIFSSFTMFRRTIRKNAKDNIYISKFGSKTIKNEVCKMYLDLLFLNGKTNFRNLKELFTLLNLGQKITVDFSPINDIKKIETKLKSDKINNLIKKNSDKINDLISNKIIKLKKNTYLNEIVNELGLQQNKNRDFEVKIFLNIIKIVKILLMLQYKNSVNNLENKDDCYLCIDGYRRNFCIYINEKGENDNNIRCEIDEILKTAFEIMDICNINYVKDLHFIDEDKTKKLSNLSSGEFAMFTRFIEIAKNLEDNSLVLIDEPEISLNPKWIYQFIYYLKKFFKNKKSHFIIASQSPFIIGSVKKEEIIKIKD
ncbi:MAG: AAA family ATPase, partial [Erysipelotrichaceae bacterium]|nr:AAA family ATPase [Erysipelotrichaceae bacterium]